MTNGSTYSRIRADRKRRGGTPEPSDSLIERDVAASQALVDDVGNRGSCYQLAQLDCVEWLPSQLDRCMRGKEPVVVLGTVFIPLFDGRVTAIDLADYQLVANRLWSVNVHGYAQTARGALLHIAIMGRRDGHVIDHVNRNRLDNRRGNLRFCTRAENVVNAGKPKTNTSGFKGVTWDSRRGKWMAQVYHRGRNVFLGRFDSATEAANAYDRAASQLHGPCLATNAELGGDL